MSDAITVNNVSKVYKLYRRRADRLRDALHLLPAGSAADKRALDHVNLNIKRGETVGVIGMNGSGKSTLLKIITGVTTPTEGSVKVDGHVSALLELGAGFNMEYNGIENIYLNGMMTGFSEKETEAKLQDILDFADIGEYVYQPIRTYSSGMFVRLAFAVAINIDPEILIVDEALSVGDVFFQAKCYHKFEEFKRAGKTILFVSHDLQSVSRYCDRVIILHDGVVRGDGSPKEMTDRYKQLLVGLKPRVPGQPSDDDAGNINPDLLEYGDGSANIESISVTDEKGEKVSVIASGERFFVNMRVKILRDLPAPVFAFTIRDIQGTEIAGTNTMIEDVLREPLKEGDVKEVSFAQRMTLAGGNYLINFGVTGFEQSDFRVYHRLYDALQISVISEKQTVGFYDLESSVTVM